MDANRKVIAKVYNKSGEYYGSIIGMSGDRVQLEVADETIEPASFWMSLKSLQGMARIEWVNVRPVGEHYGEF